MTAGGPPQITRAELQPLFEVGPLRDALQQLDGGDGAAAAAELERWLAANRADARVPWARMMLGYARLQLSDHRQALPLLLECTGALPLMADYCFYWAAQSAHALGELEEALVLATAVDRDAIFGPRARYLRARLLLDIGEHEAAAGELEAFLGDYPRAFYRNDVELDLARAYELSGNFDEAATTLFRIELLNPESAAERDARRKRDALMSRVSPEVRDRLRRTSATDTLTRAQVLFDRHRSEQVIELVTPLLDRLDPASHEACDARYLIGRSYTKLRQHRASVPHYDVVIEQCSDPDLRVRSLYNAGRGYWNVDDDDTAIARFTQLFEQYPGHSYADDAMLYVARILRGNGQLAASDAMVDRQIETYPEGDMLKDAVWLQMADLVQRGDHRAVIAFADRVADRSGENDIYSRGRIAYFRARALEQLSRTNEAAVAYTRVVERYPLTWYALLAFNRLRAIDEALATDLRERLDVPHEAVSDAIVLDPPELAADPFMARGRLFVRLGQVELASAEFERLRTRYPQARTIDRLVAVLLNEAQAFHISHRSSARRLEAAERYPNADTMSDWEVAYPRPYESLVRRFARERDLDIWLIYAIMREESGFQPRVESWANARGLMQLMIGTANDMARLTGRGSVSARQLFDPAINIELGTMFLKRLGDRFDGHTTLMIAGYNGGAGNVNSWLRARGDLPVDLWVERIPFEQTRNYVKRVSMTWWIYHWLYDEHTKVVEIPWTLPPEN